MILRNSVDAITLRVLADTTNNTLKNTSVVEKPGVSAGVFVGDDLDAAQVLILNALTGDGKAPQVALLEMARLIDITETCTRLDITIGSDTYTRALLGGAGVTHTGMLGNYARAVIQVCPQFALWSKNGGDPEERLPI